MDESAKFKEALTNYYNLKQDYDDAFRRLMLSLRENDKLSLAKKRQRLEKKCVNCDFIGKYQGGKVQEGTIFKIEVKQNSDPLQTYRVLSATCGNPVESEKCKLNIELDVGRFCLLPRIIEELEEEKKTIDTNNIIMDNKASFGYMSKEEALQVLPLLVGGAETVKRDLGDYKKELERIEANEEEEAFVKAEERTMQVFLEEFKKMMKLYYLDAGNNRSQLKEKMREFKVGYADKRKLIMELRHKKYEVKTNGTGDKVNLRFTGTPIQELDFVYLRPTKILHEDFSGRKRREQQPKNNPKEDKNPYAILNVKKKFSPEELKNNYRKLALLYHPDKYHPDKFLDQGGLTLQEAIVKFKSVKNAYDLLMDEDAKEYYDKTGQYPEGYRGGKFSLRPNMLFEMFTNNENENENENDPSF
jgi:DnaJ-domain-containing protein 1